ncbi:MAG: DUF4404 family protein [Gammaproteobacteria bacterium]|nr:DUF4404 family protein [Gammaproteobacteria bacterium]
MKNKTTERDGAAMPQKQSHDIEKQLEQLRQLVASMDDAAPETRTRITTLITEIEQQIEREPSETSEQHQGLIDNVKESIEHFEADHPAITSTLNQIMVMLANMGI